MRIAHSQALADHRRGGGCEGKSGEIAHSFDLHRVVVRRGADEAGIHAIDDHDDHRVGRPLKHAFQTAGQANPQQPPQIVPMRRQAMQVKSNSAAPQDQHDDLNHAAKDVSDDRPCCDAVESHFPHSDQAIGQTPTESHIDDVDNDEGDRRRKRVAGAAQAGVGNEHHHQKRDGNREHAQIRKSKITRRAAQSGGAGKRRSE